MLTVNGDGRLSQYCRHRLTGPTNQKERFASLRSIALRERPHAKTPSTAKRKVANRNHRSDLF